MGKKMKLELFKDHMTLGGEPFYLASGDMHYFRIYKDGWRRRLQLMKDYGLTAIQTYVPWNLHEPEEGQFCFEGNLCIKDFLELCDEIGLKVLFRPSVYMCSEWDLGGLPYWLLNKEGIGLRTSDAKFMYYAERYYRRLAEEFVPYLSTNGGPIIAVAVENEYGSFADDRAYIQRTGDLMVELGVDVPLFTANGFEPFKMQGGSRPEYWTGMDLHALTDVAINNIRSYQPDKPIYIGEFWGGRGQQWGGYFKRQEPADVAALYEDMLEKGAFVNIYMFCGGTNFGFQNGSLVGKFGADLPEAPNRFIAYATSYDVDAPVTEYGEPTAKYFACKKVLKEQIEKRGFVFGGTPDTELTEHVKTQSIQDVKLTKSADFLNNLENIAAAKVCSGTPQTMESMNQAYGFILYETDIVYTDDQMRQLVIEGLHDRATVYGNGEYLGCYMRDRKSEPIRFTIPKEGMKLQILVENMGRVNYGLAMSKDKKGIMDYVKLDLVQEDGTVYPWNYSFVANWINYSLPLKNEQLDNLDYNLEGQKGHPVFFEGTFKAEPGVDTFVNPEGWEKGVIWINGVNCGRYWSLGPQGTLYVPGSLLKEENTIRIMELHTPKADRSIRFDNKPSLDTIAEVKDLAISVVG